MTPASLCFNAVALLLDMPQNVHDFHLAVEGLLEKIATILGTFQIYQRTEQFGHIEPELNQAIHRVMISFVDICALSIKLRDSGKWRKFRVTTKAALFQIDSGVAEEIKQLEDQCAAHHSIQATQTLKVALENNAALVELLMRASETNQSVDVMAQGIKGLKESDEKRKEEEERKFHLSKIREKLGIDDKTVKASTDACSRLLRVPVRGSGAWLKELPEYARWTDSNDGDVPALLLVSGEPNTGKSVLLSSIFHDLKSKYEVSSAQSPSQKTLVASYFFPSLTAKGEDDKRLVENALKCIALQLAELDIPLAKSMSLECSRKVDGSASFFRDASCRNIWDSLGLGRPKGQTTFYIVLDGLTGLPEKFDAARDELLGILEELNDRGPSVRVVLSVRPDTPESAPFEACPCIEMEDHNEADIQKYIEEELNNDELLEESDDELRNTWETVKSRLANEGCGSYYKVLLTLKKIRGVVASGGTESDVFKVLDDGTRDDVGEAEAVISQLQETLTGEEIDELNDLLVWIVHGFQWFTVDDLKALLVRENG